MQIHWSLFYNEVCHPLAAAERARLFFLWTGNVSPFTDVRFYGIIFWQPNEPRLALEELTDDRMHHICQWESHRDHFGEAFNTFYMRFSTIMQNQKLSLLADFVKYNQKHRYRKVLVKHKNIEYTMTVKMKYHKQIPQRTNHVDIYGEWNTLVKPLELTKISLCVIFIFSSKARNLELKRRNMKNTILTTNMPYPIRKIRRIRAWTSPKYHEDKDQYAVSRIPIRRIEGTVEEYSGNIEDIKRGPYFKKAPIRRIGGARYGVSTSF
ncbi:hypothetical protein Tco_0775383 [Tanacetum coccineum]